jgi:glutathionylspermidine synthase
MRRETITPRANWVKRVESRGFTFHTLDGKPYWDESACYVFGRSEIDHLEQVTYALHNMCLKLVERVIAERRLGLFMIPELYHSLVERSWEESQPSLYGRFDLACDGHSPPKLLEYNADTPTGLLEAAVIQWDWLEDSEPGGDQFNSIDEKLVESAWPALLEQDSSPVLFMGLTENLEDLTTLEYLRDTAMRAGVTTDLCDVSQLGWDERRRQFIAPSGQTVTRAFKLYPWEWLMQDEFGQHLPTAACSWIEPPWKAILSSKAILPLLWEMFPESPYLLPASFEPLSGDCVRKPIHAREGANIQVIRNGVVTMHTDGPYDERAAIYQALAPIPNFEGHYPVIGSWVVNGWSCGLGIREDTSLITQNTSRFVPHKMG